ncbi:ferrochelatase [Atopomonas sediminilitoris]|uniref:ferrochelatase n=1 Tax=Atopomonas sediminilitoris TaxID=2919919 RepID=UPI001F4D3984|nr:ferrochelatase [Atopomonas sediminilitoris]MCJ8168084.1 ferrochelatase [Atopomonas sediminilitoris]
MTRRALLLVNLGSPASPEVADVRRYLNEFLMDPHVVDLPWPLRRLLVSLILIKRPEASAHAYKSIWWPQGSPLVEITRRLQQAVVPAWPHGPVEMAMRYGEPSVASALRRLAEQKVREVVFVPLYPQFADSTVTTCIEQAQRLITEQGLPLSLNVVPPFFNQPAYHHALASTVQPHVAEGFDHLLFSYHGLPERHLHKTDPSKTHCLKGADCCQQASGPVLDSCYRAQCYATTEALAKRLGLAKEFYSVAFQSRLGRAKWIEPYTEEAIDALAKRGVKRLLVMCPAFVADCLETLEEIGDRAREQFLAAGGEEFRLIPCLNDHPAWVDALVKIAGYRVE